MQKLVVKGLPCLPCLEPIPSRAEHLFEDCLVMVVPLLESSVQLETFAPRTAPWFLRLWLSDSTFTFISWV